MPRYARELADLSRGEAAILSKGAVLASTVSGPGGARSRRLPRRGAGRETMTLAGESWAIQPLSQLGDVTFLALASIDARPRGRRKRRCAGWRGSASARSGWPCSAACGWRGR